MANKALINPYMLTWARQRAGLSDDVLAKKLGVKKVEKIAIWENGEDQPTFGQAQKLAQITSVPFGYLFLANPPYEELPIPDLRTVGDRDIPEISLEMRDVIKQVMLKQEWYRDYLKQMGEETLPFVGRFTTKSSIKEVAQDIRNVINVPIPNKGGWEQYYTELIQGAENARILVMRSGIVGNNTHRKLEVSEFRGFALCDELAPVVFINSSDAPAARLFTLIHELAHLWIGSSGVSDTKESDAQNEEMFCNSVASEFLVPSEDFEAIWNNNSPLDTNLTQVSTTFHVSKIVVARKALGFGYITKKQYWSFYNSVIKAFRDKKGGGSGDFNRNAGAKNSHLFSSAVVAEALSGRMLLRDAGQLLGIKPNKIKTYASTLSL
ncbi:ImmA/IrrE family metallo-endopeptidase [Vibrio sp. M260112]|uniref:ImmA/IrrE family metallo-endopeptidase n=1 Tax=Vibrio sp. M260112 TaxID=3020895 RepID=UPI002F3FAC9C